MKSLDGINGRSIQTLLRGENDLKQSDEFQAMRSSDFIFLRKLDMLRVLTESGIEFQIDTPILVKDFFTFSVLENLTEKHSFADNRVL